MSTRSRPRKAIRKTKTPHIDGLGIIEPLNPDATAMPPLRLHAESYHWPLLLTDRQNSAALLKWFEGVEDEREMPWRKKWVDPDEFDGTEEEFGEMLSKRAYEVWVSETMLQQTRVSTVIPYFKKWISRWPTVHDLSKAGHDDVLSIWKGLGYYSRATRLHQGAQRVVEKNDEPCPIPVSAEQLQLIPGIGRYTAGAISSIAFGEAEPVLDGNVARVLSRQLGLYVDAKEKKSSDFLWRVADRLIKYVSVYPKTKRSAVPGQWNQALMELGSTICTPRPKCGECPIRRTCRAYAEGEALLDKGICAPKVPDIEDSCSHCAQLDTEDLGTAPAGGEDIETKKAIKKRKPNVGTTNKISHYFSTGTPEQSRSTKIGEADGSLDAAHENVSRKRKAPNESVTSNFVSTYCSLFPKKVAKKKVAEEECVVCVVEGRLSDGPTMWLIEQRPAKGLLASLWQFPLHTLLTSKSSTTFSRKSAAERLIHALNLGDTDMSVAQHKAELGTLTHVFSHLKLTMHVHSFLLQVDADKGLEHALTGPPKRKWVDTESMDRETLSTGMRKCWELIKGMPFRTPTP
ncbi:DNA glycosylase [Zopfia rhizophila CBS 207.26]|uniref:Adenine DNA glycosylase n=1 Tax=Zopfia rhizophila CBS 207.26 TaxID=1314779 RepID=A0A6A6ETP0_9PEZI|nr:DNA glycosylase [Zopfia rhizophila CBS 207.26]